MNHQSFGLRFPFYASVSGDLPKEIMARTSDQASGWHSTFGPEPLALSPVHIGSGSLSGGLRNLCLIAVHELYPSHVSSLLPRLTSLTALDLSHNPFMDDSVGQSIASSCEHKLINLGPGNANSIFRCRYFSDFVAHQRLQKNCRLRFG